MNGGAPSPEGRSRGGGGKRHASPLGNPVKEHILEYHMPYYGKHAMQGDDVTKKTPFYGDYHKTLDAYHLYTGRHPHPMSMIENAQLSRKISSKSRGARLEPIPNTRRRKARLVPVGSLSHVACGMHKKKDEEKDEDEGKEEEEEEEDEYHGYGRKKHGKDDQYHGYRRYGGRKHNKRMGDAIPRRKAKLVPISDTCRKAKLVPISDTCRKAKLVPISDTRRKAKLVPISDEVACDLDTLPDFEDFL